jgi:hypothetical protein
VVVEAVLEIRLMVQTQLAILVVLVVQVMM